MPIEIVQPRRRGPSMHGRKSNAEYQAARRARDAKFGIAELRGIRVSFTERQMLDDLVAALNYSSRTELLMTLARKEADKHKIDYRVKRGG